MKKQNTVKGAESCAMLMYEAWLVAEAQAGDVFSMASPTQHVGEPWANSTAP